MNDAFFANRLFVLGDHNGFKFLLWGEVSLDGESFSSMSHAEPMEGAFLCELETGWLFVAGQGEHNNFRHTFFDDSTDAAQNASAMQRLDIPVLPIDVAKQQINADGIPLYSITREEELRREARSKAARR